jgi:GNAT superfamily N-acetyltransferase
MIENSHRLFVLPDYQHKGYGKALLDFAEKKILELYECVQIDASFPAKRIYLKKALPHSRDFNRELGSAYFIFRK